MIDDFFALVIIGAGFYLLYAARELKSAHHIVQSVILTTDLQGKTCKDMDGLVRYVFPRLMILACVTTLLGVYELMVSYAGLTGGFSVLEIVLYAVFFGVLFYYMRCMRHVRTMFY